MPNVKLQYLKAGEYQMVREEKELPTPVLIAEELGADVAISISRPAIKAVALTRQLDLNMLPKVFDELLEYSSEEKPPVLYLLLLGGKSSEVSYKMTPQHQYLLEALKTVEKYVGDEAKYVKVQNQDSNHHYTRIEGDRCHFHIMGAEILNRPHPETIYLAPRLLQAAEYTPKIKKAFGACPIPSEPLLPAAAASLRAASAGPLISQKRARNESPPDKQNVIKPKLD